MKGLLSIISFSILLIAAFIIYSCNCEDLMPFEPTIPEGLLAEFSANTTEIQAGETVSFRDQSFGDPTSWQWTFEGGDPSTSSRQNPVVTYPEPGVFGVSLLISNQLEQDENIKEAFITVITAETPEIDTEQEVIDTFQNCYRDFKDLIEYVYLFDGHISGRAFVDISWRAIVEKVWNDSDEKIQDLWTLSYEKIYTLNNLIEILEENFPGTSIQDEYTAQARVMRSFVYYYLYQLFGDVPIERVGTPSDNLSRDSIFAVQQFMLDDLNETINSGILPEFSSENTLFNNSAALGLVLRVLIDRKNWNAASATANEIINPGLFSLAAEYANAFEIDNPEVMVGCPIGSTPGFGQFFQGSLVPVIRYAEVLLNSSEASFEVRNTSIALDQMNQIRARMGQDPLSILVPPKSFSEQWLTEYVQEGYVFITLKRYDLVENELGIESFRRLLPIPKIVIAENPGMFQNPGY